MPKSVPDPDADVTYELRIQLADITPPIWRTFIVPGYIGLDDLNYVVQIVMGWTNSHLHEFGKGARRFAPPNPEADDYGPKVFDEADFILEDLLKRPNQSLSYLYDLGDGWSHLITLKAIRPKRCTAPKVLAGERACPPEDCGGSWGYAEKLKAWADPEHEEHQEILDWLPEGYDPEVYPMAEVNKLSRRALRLRLRRAAVIRDGCGRGMAYG